MRAATAGVRGRIHTGMAALNSSLHPVCEREERHDRGTDECANDERERQVRRVLNNAAHLFAPGDTHLVTRVASEGGSDKSVAPPYRRGCMRLRGCADGDARFDGIEHSVQFGRLQGTSEEQAAAAFETGGEIAITAARQMSTNVGTGGA